MFSVLGSSGLVGSHVLSVLRRAGTDVLAPGRSELDSLPRHLGRVIYCIGLTADFRQRPIETVEAHVARLADVLRRHDYDSFTYLSATRFYHHADGAREDSRIHIDVADPEQLYDLSKLAGEALVLHGTNGRGRVVRLANVFGPDFDSPLFLPAVLREAAQTGATKLLTAPDSAKDYIAVEDVAKLLPVIASEGRRSIYNLSSGSVVTNREIADILQTQGVSVDFAAQAPTVAQPAIDNAVLRAEFGFSPTPLSAALPALLQDFRDHFAEPKAKEMNGS